MKPLIAECSKRELEIQRLQEEVKSRTKNLKILFAITKSPKMSDLVYKAERKRFTQEKMKQIHESAILTLRQYRFDESNADKFIDFVYSEVLGQVLGNPTDRPESRSASPQHEIGGATSPSPLHFRKTSTSLE